MPRHTRGGTIIPGGGGGGVIDVLRRGGTSRLPGPPPPATMIPMSAPSPRPPHDPLPERLIALGCALLLIPCGVAAGLALLYGWPMLAFGLR